MTVGGALGVALDGRLGAQSWQATANTTIDVPLRQARVGSASSRRTVLCCSSMGVSRTLFTGVLEKRTIGGQHTVDRDLGARWRRRSRAE
jgi:hypothetical protein